MALSKIDVSKMITGVTPLANGGTGGTSIPATNLASGVTGTLPVGSGGTGLTSGTTDQILKFTGTTTIASAAEAAGGKVLQIQRKVLPTTVYTTGTTPVDITNQTITCSATSSYVFAFLSTNYAMLGNDNTSNPYGNIRIKQDSTTTNTKADCGLRDVAATGATNVQRNYIGSLTAYWTPNSTSQITVYVTVEMGTTTGSIANFGTNTSTNATTLTLFEIGA